MTRRNTLRLATALLAAAFVLAGCDEKRVDRTPGSSGANAAPAERQKSAVQQAEERAAAATQRLQDAQNNANSSDQEKEDAVRQYEAERQAIANGSDAQGATGDSTPPPQ